MLSTCSCSVSQSLGLFTGIFLAAGLTACTGLGITSKDTGLTGSSYHAGTLTILRIDDAWHHDPEQRGHYKIDDGIQKKKRGRFVPLRGKMDIAGLDGPDRVVTKDDLVTITLNSAFIKFFQEEGGRTASGEIAVVLSFSAGSTVKESLLIHSSRGQTLGSFLDLQDWPVVGPVKIDGDSLLIRIVIIELDQRENEQKRQTVRVLAGIGTTINPGLGQIFAISQQIADFIISQNSDDVIFDQKFSFHRVDSSLPITRSPLLYGKYVLLMQEDKFVHKDAKAVAPRSILPPAVEDMRYDSEFDRVAKVYNYFPNPELKKKECQGAGDIEVRENSLPTFWKSLYEGVGSIDYDSFFPQPDGTSVAVEQGMRPCVLKKLVNAKIAKDLREAELGYREPVVGELKLYPDLDIALKIAYLDGIRHFLSARALSSQDEVKKFDSQLNRLFGDARPPGEIPFNYPVTQYPEAYTLVAQYPLHTYLVLSIDRSLGGDGQQFHQRFQTFVDFINNEMQSARDNDRIGALTDALDRTVRARRTQRALLRKVDRLEKAKEEPQSRFDGRRVCRLWQDGLHPINGGEASTSPLSDAPVYNEIFHITGQSFSNRNEVAEYLTQQSWTVDENKHTCMFPAKVNDKK